MENWVIWLVILLVWVFISHSFVRSERERFQMKHIPQMVFKDPDVRIQYTVTVILAPVFFVTLMSIFTLQLLPRLVFGPRSHAIKAYACVLAFMVSRYILGRYYEPPGYEHFVKDIFPNNRS